MARASLELVPAAQQVAAGSSLDVTVRLRNVSDGDLWVNTRMLLNTVHAPRPMREVWIEVAGPDGESIPFSCKVRAGRAGADAYDRLRPQQAREIRTDLAECFDLKQPGRYRITAHYQDGTEGAPAAPAGAAYLAEALESAPVEVELLP